jgi:hypothetical protein
LGRQPSFTDWSRRILASTVQPRLLSAVPDQSLGAPSNRPTYPYGRSVRMSPATVAGWLTCHGPGGNCAKVCTTGVRPCAEPAQTSAAAVTNMAASMR